MLPDPPFDSQINMIEQEFVFNKTILIQDFNSPKNMQKKNWFLETFDEITRPPIREEYYQFVQKHKIHLSFFDWLEHYSTYFDQLNVITNAEQQWVTSNNIIKPSIHPPLEQIHIQHRSSIITASPFKLKSDTSPPDAKDISNLFQQNNFTNQTLKTIGDQLTRVENFVTKEQITTLTTTEAPLFTPHDVPLHLQNELRDLDFSS